MELSRVALYRLDAAGLVQTSMLWMAVPAGGAMVMAVLLAHRVGMLVRAGER